MTTYLARVRHDGSIRIYRDDQPEPVSRPFTLSPDGSSLRGALREAGWRPTGWRAPGGGWGSIYVARLAMVASSRDRNDEDPAAARDRRPLRGRRSRPPARRTSAADRPVPVGGWPLSSSISAIVQPGSAARWGTPMDERAWRFGERFRKVSNRYPLRVTEAYDYDLDRAMADSDEQVAATVAEWERRHGLPIRDWRAVGVEERDESGD
jgi:hypothetical protein